MSHPPMFARVKQILDPLARRLGDRNLKAACAELAQDLGNGKRALRALGYLRAVPYHLGPVDEARHLLEGQLAQMGAQA